MDTAEAAADWHAIAFETGTGDSGRTLAALRLAYADAGLTMPEHVAWVPSPLHGAVAAVLAADPDARESLLDAGLGPVLADVPLSDMLLAGEAGRPVRELVRTRPWEAARAASYADLGSSGWPRACTRYAATWEQANDLVTRIRRRLGELGGDDAGPALRRASLDAVLGQHDAPWLGTFAALGRLDGLRGLAAAAAETGWWWPYENLVIVSGRPAELHRDEAGRLHRGDGPALVYPGGFELHAWRGMPLPPGFLESLAQGTVNARQIAAEENAELRRVMLECYGYDRYIADIGAKPVHRDETGVLWRIPLRGDEPVVMVEVVNSTPEPDGTRRTYWLRVPPGTRTAKEGVAWTFGLTEWEYDPETQT